MGVIIVMPFKSILYGISSADWFICKLTNITKVQRVQLEAKPFLAIILPHPNAIVVSHMPTQYNPVGGELYFKQARYEYILN